MKLIRFASVATLALFTGSAFAATETAPISTMPTVQSAAPIQPSELTSQPTIAPQVAPTVPAGDVAVAEKIRDLLASKLNQNVARQQDRPGVLAFYEQRGFAPLWIGHDEPLARAKDAITYLRGVGAEGLDRDDYPTPSFIENRPEQLAAEELKLTTSILTFARHASTGRVAFSRVSGSVYFEKKFDAAEALATIAAADNVVAALDAFNPQHTSYKALKAELSAATKSADSRQDRIDTIIANMERWRWMPHELGPTYIVVNVPDYTLKVVQNGATVWTTRIVVGKPGDYATPLITETMKSITVNPTWNVPPSIIRNEYLPALARDPGALTRAGLQMGRNKDGSIRIFQPPGERNALGRLRFNFPNRFLVYQHDTPQKHLFAKTARAFSHGCMRVQNPEKYAEVLLSISQPEENVTAKRISGMYGSGERTIRFKTPIPVYITYQTAFVDDAGHLQMRPDVYRLDKSVATLLNKDRRIADVPVARNYNSSSKPVMSAQGAGSPSRAARKSEPSRSAGYRTRPENNREFSGSTFGYGWGFGNQPTYHRFGNW